MKSNYKKLGNYIRQVDNRNSDLSVKFLQGVSTTKKLIKSVANVTGLEFSSYKIVKINQFVYVADTSRRGDKIGLALNTDTDCIVSSIYTVFEVIDVNQLIPEFLMLWFKRPEFDRYSRFHSWGSARETFNWEDMCEISMPIPDIEIQKSMVSAYSSLAKNQTAFSSTLSDMQLVCDSFMENLAKNHGLKTLDKYIQQLDERNIGSHVNNLLGISINKIFFPSNTNQTNLSLDGYKVVNKSQFAFVTVTSRNGEKISVAMLDSDPGIVSSTYTVFKINDESGLLPEFLLLWFKRPDFDRYARFHSWGSARETFSWDDMCSVKLPIPDIDTQKSIVAIHKALESRKRINIKLLNTVTPLCSILMKGVADRSAIN